MRALRNERSIVKELKKEVSKHKKKFDYFRVSLDTRVNEAENDNTITEWA